MTVKISFFDLPETRVFELDLDQSLEELINALYLSNQTLFSSERGENEIISSGTSLSPSSAAGGAGGVGDYCLRFASTWELITDQNYRKRLKNGDSLLFQFSPVLEARRSANILHMAVKGAIESENSLKKSFYKLQRCLKEYVFFREFSACNGLVYFMTVITKLSGNTLSYALACLQSILEYSENEWKFCLSSQDLLSLLVRCVFSNSLNVARNATGILVKLVTIGFYDFESLRSVNASIISKLLDRLNSKENGTQCISMQLINILLKSILNSPKEKDNLAIFYEVSLRRTVSVRKESVLI